VPIPVFYDRETNQEVLLNEDTLQHIQDIFEQHGSDAWWRMTEKELLPEKYKDESDKWIKGTDTMDVWFDSGSSWNGVLQIRGQDYPADLYLEGSDQHRGWFQSSLLTSVAASSKAPYKAVLTHGFVLDEKGFKMSKSLGNVMDPLTIIQGGNNKKKEPAYGADVLRLWVASVDYSGDVCIGNNILQQTFESYRKLRNTLRYLLGNLNDYDFSQHQVDYDNLPNFDQWILGQSSLVWKRVDEAMSEFQFQRAIQELLRFASSDLSNFYLDVAKDRLYISAPNDVQRRRSCQTVLHHVLLGLVKSLSPILPHLAEDAWQNYLDDSSEGGSTSVFEGGFPEHLMEFPLHEEEKWNFIRTLRDDVNKALEKARADKLVGASLDAAAYIYTGDNSTMREILSSLHHEQDLFAHSSDSTNHHVDDLCTILMLSQVNLVNSPEEMELQCNASYILDASSTTSGCMVGVTKARGTKCERCWFHHENPVQEGQRFPTACPRCNHAIASWEQVNEETFVYPGTETTIETTAVQKTTKTTKATTTEKQATAE